MPISSYSVLTGRPTAGKVITGKSNHYQITVEANGGPFTVAVNIQSTDGSEVLYAIVTPFTPPDPRGLPHSIPEFIRCRARRAGLAIDYVRSTVNGKPMITLAQMSLLPKNLTLTPYA